MSFLSRLLPSGRKIERELEELYAPILGAQIGLSSSEARKLASALIRDAAVESKRDGTDKITGAFIIHAVLKPTTTEGIAEHDAKRRDGVRPEDYRWWWGLSDLERRMLLKIDELHRTAAFMQFESEGLSQADALWKVRKHFPIFGDCMDTSKVQREDRALPNELKDRINAWVSTNGLDADTLGEAHSTMNAAIRSLIRSGAL